MGLNPYNGGLLTLWKTWIEAVDGVCMGGNRLGTCSQEAGVARFDVIQQQDDPTKFVLVEVYKYAACL